VNPPPGGGGATPPPNNTPVIQGITIQGSRAMQPPNFADIGEAIDVAATVRDDETAVEQLQYVWSAPVGTFSGTGAKVSWHAPASIQAPNEVTIRLEVVEKYGQNQMFEHRASSTATLSLHDSVKEVGDMSRQFLLDFSDTNIKDTAYIMRNFAAPAQCPQPSEVLEERDQVTNHHTNFRMIDFRIGVPSVTVSFGGSCAITGKRGDACAVVPAFWHSMNLQTNRPERVDGDDILAAIYSTADSRWFLCASNYIGRSLLSRSTPSFYIR
jgi:hypothetical protein